MHELRDTFETFMHTNFIYKSKASLDLLAEMTPKDKKEFPFDVRHIDWDL
jgi:hypothetical protein